MNHLNDNQLEILKYIVAYQIKFDKSVPEEKILQTVYTIRKFHNFKDEEAHRTLRYAERLGLINVKENKRRKMDYYLMKEALLETIWTTKYKHGKMRFGSPDYMEVFAK